MKFKGAYDGSATYDVGDVVIYTDDVVYHLVYPCDAGTVPHDNRYWARLDGIMSEAVRMIRDAMGILNAKIPTNIDSESIVLKSGDDEYLISVDATGDTPELAVELIEDEEAGDELS